LFCSLEYVYPCERSSCAANDISLYQKPPMEEILWRLGVRKEYGLDSGMIPVVGVLQTRGAGVFNEPFQPCVESCTSSMSLNARCWRTSVYSSFWRTRWFRLFECILFRDSLYIPSISLHITSRRLSRLVLLVLMHNGSLNA
jgi:hypothetical protein